MSKIQPEEIVVDFNMIKKEISPIIEEVKPKGKRASNKK